LHLYFDYAQHKRQLRWPRQIEATGNFQDKIQAFSMPSLFSSLFGLRCPTCRRGDLFPTSSFSFSKPFLQWDQCPKCGQNFFPEPGFYYGAMFISYIGSAFFCLGFVMLLHWILDWSIAGSFAALLAVAGLLFVWWFRFSRSAYFHLVTKYKPEVTQAVDNGKLNVPAPEATSKN
jgi:uncharacterized protein (DUF983 family)